MAKQETKSWAEQTEMSPYSDCALEAFTDSSDEKTVEASGEKIDIMTAPVSELVEARGVGLAKAKDIEALREREGVLSRSFMEGLSTFQGADLSAFQFSAPSKPERAKVEHQ